MKESLKQNFGYLFEEELLHEIVALGMLKKVPQGETMINIGDFISGVPLLLDGAIKVMREDELGDELLLYFIESGDTCAMTFSCFMGTRKSDIRAVAESDTQVLMIPLQQMELWMAKYKTWRRFILDSYHSRLQELLETVDTLAFMRMDERLLKHLQDKAKVNHSDVIHTTHQEIAADLHTSRVVVSRLLKKMEKEHIISMNRNQIKLLQL
ncbi:Crp/Fnr family transcriptional regulator [Costertonia aggregata]|uniref:Crp/Fnr family transcriptional regulator n=1 Tax=Costertonia aggregata TaxID=343403 RepID=A0A7H9ARN5_9FLAO|nr:Crp/Fnr family transcriptional regulator [Costertonia aggregata]QLG46151.1 Crp/Fnr family transcriptional regulator [Costertonia aggregata]